jgi:hypothetical protein
MSSSRLEVYHRNNGNKRPSYLDYNRIKMKGIDDLKKWSEETTEYVVDKKSNGAQHISEKVPSPIKKNVPEEIDLLGLDEPAPKPSQTQPITNTNVVNDEGSSRSKLPAPPLKKQDVQNHPDAELDLLGGDFTQNQKTTQQPLPQIVQQKPVSNLDLFDLNLNM